MQTEHLNYIYLKAAIIASNCLYCLSLCIPFIERIKYSFMYLAERNKTISHLPTDSQQALGWNSSCLTMHNNRSTTRDLCMRCGGVSYCKFRLTFLLIQVISSSTVLCNTVLGIALKEIMLLIDWPACFSKTCSLAILYLRKDRTSSLANLADIQMG